MRALSLKQPWAWLVANGLKPVENRTWQLPQTFKVPQRVYIHAGLKQDYAAYEGDPAYGYLRQGIRNLLDSDAVEDWNTTPMDLGAIIGEVTITGCVTESDSPWFTGPFGFVLEDAIAYRTPVPWKGRLGFFGVPDNIREGV